MQPTGALRFDPNFVAYRLTFCVFSKRYEVVVDSIDTANRMQREWSRTRYADGKPIGGGWLQRITRNDFNALPFPQFVGSSR